MKDKKVLIALIRSAGAVGVAYLVGATIINIYINKKHNELLANLLKDVPASQRTTFL